MGHNWNILLENHHPRAWQKQPTAKNRLKQQINTATFSDSPFNDALALRISVEKTRMDSGKPTLRFQTTPKTGLSAAKFQGGHRGHHPIATKTPTRFCCDESEVSQDLTISTVSSGRLARTESGSQPTEKSTFGLFFQLLLLFEVTTWTVLQNQWEGRGDKTSLFFLRCKSSTSNNLNCQAGH